MTDYMVAFNIALLTALLSTQLGFISSHLLGIKHALQDIAKALKERKP